ncbi:MAG: hypothetical protein QXO32_08820 [Candidatus Bathyarchaeia archaeon]
MVGDKTHKTRDSIVYEVIKEVKLEEEFEDGGDEKDEKDEGD